MKKLVIIDHFLIGGKGHEEQYDLSVAKEALRRGLKTEVWCPADSKASKTEYMKYRLKTPFWTVKSRLAKSITAFLSIFEWRDIFKNGELDGDTLVLIENIKFPIFICLSLGLIGIKVRPTVAVVLRREPGNMVEKALMAYLYKRKNFIFMSDSDLITEKLKKDGFIDAKTLPIPHMPPRSTRQRSGNEWEIGYFGETRYDKGFDLLPGLVDKVLEKEKTARFMIQMNMHKATVEMKKAGEQLHEIARKYPERIDMVHRYLPDNEYEAYLRKCDIILIPYRKEYYGKGTSGVLAEAIACGAWAVVPEGTWMSEQKNKYLKIRTFPEASSETLAQAVDDCIGGEGKVDPVTLKQQIDGWYDFHSARNYLEIICRG